MIIREQQARRWISQGVRIGWVAAQEVFLELEVSYRVAQQFAGAERLPISAQTLRHHLREQGLLASVEVGRQTLLVRRILERFPERFRLFRAGDLLDFDQNES